MLNKTALFLMFTFVSTTILTAQTPPRPAPVQTVGGAASIDALRDAYLVANREHSAEKLERLFLWTGVPASQHQMFSHDILDSKQPIASSRVKDVDPSAVKEYKRYHRHFNAPVLKMLEIHSLPAKGDEGGIETDLYIGQSQGRFYFLSTVSDGTPDQHGQN